MADPYKPDPKEGGGSSFFRKVVKFVANPATDWAELETVQEEPQQSGYAKSELKAMIERKRRNDFVRKREFDMLRKIRREGVPADGLAAIGGLSDLEDSDQPRTSTIARPDVAVKAKIDEIEQQMEGESIGRRTVPAHPPSFYTASTEQGGLDERSGAMNRPFADTDGRAHATTQPPDVADAPATTPSRPAPLSWDPTAPVPGLQAEVPRPAARGSDFNDPFAVEVNEIPHDPELDEAVISFANAEFEACERAIADLISPQGDRANHAETWLVLFDLYRATGRQPPFEALAIEYVQRFGWSAPQWFSIPALVAAEAAAAPPAPTTAAAGAARDAAGSVGWIAPAELTPADVAELRAKTLQMPLPWTLDWSGVRRVEPEACTLLSELLRRWSEQKIEMRWIGLDRLLGALTESAPTGMRDADPVFWLLRLEALRLGNRPDQFDEVAIDYCVTYEVSPPSWEKALCKVKLVDGSGMSLSSRSAVTDVSTGFAESVMVDEPGGMRTAAVELSGQLVGDIGKTLAALEARLGTSSVVNVNCQRLIRMDFVAAGDLLNWVLSRRSENRLVHFDDAHRLLALFFNAMGINEHARVKVRNI